MAALRRSIPRQAVPAAGDPPRRCSRSNCVLVPALLTFRLVLTLWLVHFALYNQGCGGRGSECEDPVRLAAADHSGRLLACSSCDARRLSFANRARGQVVAASNNRCDRNGIRAVFDARIWSRGG